MKRWIVVLVVVLFSLDAWSQKRQCLRVGEGYVDCDAPISDTKPTLAQYRAEIARLNQIIRFNERQHQIRERNLESLIFGGGPAASCAVPSPQRIVIEPPADLFPHRTTCYTNDVFGTLVTDCY